MDEAEKKEALRNFTKRNAPFVGRKRPYLGVIGDFERFTSKSRSALARIAATHLTAIPADQAGQIAPDEPLVYVNWSYDDTVPVFLTKRRVINGRRPAIRKSEIHQAFQKTFGYALAVDPLTYTGKMVVKNDQNSVKDGKIVRGPVGALMPGQVYEREVKNQIPRGIIVDIRVIVVCGHIPVVYHSFRKTEKRFRGMNDACVLSRPLDVLTKDELAKLIIFATSINLDYGEIDVLRDLETGEMFVCDVNNTPSGPPIAFTKPAYEIAVWLAADAVLREFYRPL